MFLVALYSLLGFAGLGVGGFRVGGGGGGLGFRV